MARLGRGIPAQEGRGENCVRGEAARFPCANALFVVFSLSWPAPLLARLAVVARRARRGAQFDLPEHERGT